ncbi:MAG TPA: hypothetical protein VN229_13485, partial [Terriglobales bacterium]|nr:hypothetical protein [Terriglobales bacterium]
MKNTISLRERFVRGHSLTGIIDFIGAPMAVEILARAGIDFVIIDMEHCPMDLGRWPNSSGRPTRRASLR